MALFKLSWLVAKVTHIWDKSMPKLFVYKGAFSLHLQQFFCTPKKDLYTLIYHLREWVKFVGTQ